MNAIMVCVDYSDILAMTLPYNRHHFDRVMVVTSLTDSRTRDLAWNYGCDVHLTNSFYRDGAYFNKWKALEEGLTVLGRKGWLCIMDADILWPREVDLNRYLHCGYLYTPRRYMIDPIPNKILKEEEWNTYPLHPQDREFAGYTQIFHADDKHLDSPPWHQTNWKHAGGADSFFQAKWPEPYKVRPNFRVLHLGASGQNWCGRVTPYQDGTIPEQSRERSEYLRGMLAQRRHTTTGSDRFAAERIPGQSAE